MDMSTPKPPPTMQTRLANSRGGRIGGKSRMENLTPEERKALAKKAAEARWSKEKSPIKA
jgi:hypothetical protein